MKKKALLLASIATLSLLLPLTLHKLKEKGVSGEEDEVVYSADFEGVVINANNAPDKPTGFIWAQEYLDVKTEPHNGSTMLYMKAGNPDAAGWSSVGGFGTGSKANLAKCKQGETYICSTYLEIHNMEYLEVEFVGGGDKWGAIKVYEDGRTLADPGGNNICDIYYVDNVLSFRFTYSYNEDAGMNGWIQFKSYQSNGGYCYFDNCSIKHVKNAMEKRFDDLDLGVFDSTDAFLHLSNIYGQTSDLTPTTEIVDVSGDRELKVSYNCQTEQGQAVFYLNKLNVLNKGRDYEASMEIKVENVNKLFLQLGGGWVSPLNELAIDFTSSSISVTKGEDFYNVAFDFANNILTFKFFDRPYEGPNDSFQFCVLAEGKSGSDVNIYLDDVVFHQVPIEDSIIIDTSLAQTIYPFGGEFKTDGVVVHLVYSDGSTAPIDVKDVVFSGYDMRKEGKQTVLASYHGFEITYQINVVRIEKELILTTDGVKTNYDYGEELDLSNLVVTLVYEDGMSTTILDHDALGGGYAVFAGEFDSRKPGIYTITIIHNDVLATFDVMVAFNPSYNFSEISYIGGGINE